MGGLACCGKCILILVNIIFLLIGLIVLGVGALLVYVANDAQALTGQLGGMLSGLPMVGSLVTELVAGSDAANALIEMVKTLGIPFIVIGLFFVVVSLIGCIAACCSSRVLLIVYTVIVGVFLLAEVLGAIVVFAVRDKVAGNIQGEWKKLLSEHYTYNGTDPVTAIMTAGEMLGECCGITGLTDYDSFVKWQATKPGSVNTPPGCCKWDMSDPSSPTMVDATGCQDTPSDANRNANGCWDKFMELVDANKTWAIIIACCVMGFQLLLMVCAIIVCKDIKV